MADQQTRRMHTVPRGYLEAFAVQDPERRKPAIWRFDRTSGEPKLVGVRDAEVVKDIYTLFSVDGAPDTAIEDTMLCDVEGAFCTTRNELIERSPVRREQWFRLAAFIAVQLLRTPRELQLMRDEMDAVRIAYARDTPQRVMLELIRRWEYRVARMNGIIARNETDLPLLTCDNPAVRWKKRGAGFAESLKAVLAERHDIDPPPERFNVHLGGGTLPVQEVKRLNMICIANAHRYVYANYNNEQLQRFLTDKFFGKPAPVRLRDFRPVGDPVG
jgi:hypothetical protein